MRTNKRPPGWTDIFLPPDERRKIIREYGIKWGMNTLVETGTNDGSTPLYLKDDFDAIFTIELGYPQYARASAILAPYPNITCFHGNSIECLPLVLAMLLQPALFWLDGHYSGPGTARGQVDTPIREELEIILKDDRPHVILVDDARCFKEGLAWEEQYRDYPTIGWVQDLAIKNHYDFLLEDDIMRLTPREITTH